MALTNKIPVDNKEGLKNVEMNSIDSQVTGMKSFQNFSIVEMGKFFKECIQPKPSFKTNYQSVLLFTLTVVVIGYVLRFGSKCTDWACLFYSDYYTMTPIPIGNAETLIVILGPTNPSSKMLI